VKNVRQFDCSGVRVFGFDRTTERSNFRMLLGA